MFEVIKIVAMLEFARDFVPKVRTNVIQSKLNIINSLLKWTF